MDKKSRCSWVTKGDQLYEHYHDTEWGVPIFDDRKLFEFLILESAQAGLSWITILRKREHYRKAFAGFDPKKVARFTDRNVAQLLRNERIVRNRTKIKSAINNANRFLEVQKECGTFSSYVWSFVGDRPIERKRNSRPLSISHESEALSKDLKKRGFTFFGPTTAYAFMQAIGMVNDHEHKCFRYNEIRKVTR